MAEESKNAIEEEKTIIEQAEKQVADKFKISGNSKANQILSLSPEGIGNSNVRRKFLNQLTAKTPLQEHEIYYLGVIEPSIFDLLKQPGKRTIKDENGEEHNINEDTDLLELLGGTASFLKDVKDSLFGKTINSTEIRVAVHKKTGDTTFYSKPNDNALDRMVAIAKKMYEDNGNNRFVISSDNEKTCKKFAEKLQAAGLVPVIDHKNPAVAMKLYKDIKAKSSASLSTQVLSNLESYRGNPDISNFLNKYYEDNPHEVGRHLQQDKDDTKPKMRHAAPNEHENIHSAPIPPVVNEQNTLTASISHREAVSAIGGTAGPGGIHFIEQKISSLNAEISALNAETKSTNFKKCDINELRNFMLKYLEISEKCEEIRNDNENLSRSQIKAIESIEKKCDIKVSKINKEIENKQPPEPGPGQDLSTPRA